MAPLALALALAVVVAVVVVAIVAVAAAAAGPRPGAPFRGGDPRALDTVRENLRGGPPRERYRGSPREN